MTKDVHKGQPVAIYGDDLDSSELIVIMLHGRGATADGLLPLAEALHQPGIRFLMPQAARDYWYPNSAFASVESNQPDLDSALNLISELVDDLQQEGFGDDQIVFGGFSQGACLASEFVARNARPYAGLFVFSGALIGPPGSSRDYQGEFEEMPVFIGGSDVDPWVSHDLLEETAQVFRGMGAEVDFQTYPGMGHTVNQDELDRVGALLVSRMDDQ